MSSSSSLADVNQGQCTDAHHFGTITKPDGKLRQGSHRFNAAGKGRRNNPRKTVHSSVPRREEKSSQEVSKGKQIAKVTLENKQVNADTKEGNEMIVTNPAILAATITGHNYKSFGDSESEELCFICAEPIIYYALSSCNHRTCHLCTLRLRALYKGKHCAHCRTEQQQVIFTRDPEKIFQDYGPNELPYSDSKLNIRFEDKQMMIDTMILLRFNCPHPTCEVTVEGKYKELKKHVKIIHDRYICDLCLQNKKIFTHEHTLFTYQQLHIHTKYGDKDLLDKDLSGFRGHPECGFCKVKFYGDDELYAHCREKHEQCHICTRRGGETRHQYYANYEALEEHFKAVHHLCPHRTCLEQKFIVFDTELDLKAHLTEQHNHVFSAREMKNARKLDLNTTYANSRPGVQREIIGTMSPNARTLAVRRANFGAALSNAATPFPGSDVPVQQEPSTAGASPTQVGPRDPSQLQHADSSTQAVSSENASTFVTLATDPETLVRHNAYLNRVSAYLGNDAQKLSEFRSAVGNLRASRVSPNDFMEIVSNLMEQNLDLIGKTVTELTELFDSNFCSALLRAWNDYRAQQNQFPALMSLSVFDGTARNKAARVMVVKSSSTKGSRPARVSTNVWERVERAASNSQSSIGDLPAVSQTRAGVSRTVWSSSSGSRSQAAASTITANVPTKRTPRVTFATSASGFVSRRGTTGSGPTEAEFPSLPSQPARPLLVNSSRRATVNAWSAHSDVSSSVEQNVLEELRPNPLEQPSGDTYPGKGKKKKQKKTKTLLLYNGL